MATAFQADAFQTVELAFQIDVDVVADAGLGGGGFWDWPKGRSDRRGERWKKRREQLDRIERSLAGIAEDIPSDIAEAQPLATAKAAVAKAERVLSEPPGPSFDWPAVTQAFRDTQTALKAAERALAAYQVKLADEDDDDDLFLMS